MNKIHLIEKKYAKNNGRRTSEVTVKRKQDGFTFVNLNYID